MHDKGERDAYMEYIWSFEVIELIIESKITKEFMIGNRLFCVCITKEDNNYYWLSFDDTDAEEESFSRDFLSFESLYRHTVSCALTHFSRVSSNKYPRLHFLCCFFHFRLFLCLHV